jgi:transcriptional regulator with XRE-family HTH domain
MRSCAWPPSLAKDLSDRQRSIRVRRIAEGTDRYLSLRQLAEAAGLTSKRISDIELGKVEATDDELKTINAALAKKHRTDV